MSYLKTRFCMVFLLSFLFADVAMANPEFTSQDFIDAASIRSISEVETAKIALEQSSSASVRVYAQQVIDEQTAVLLSLRKLAEAEHLIMPSDTELQANARSYVFQRKGKTFDAAYADMRVIERKKSVSLFRDVAKKASGNIKLYALKQLPTLMHHLYMAQTLVGDVAKDSFLMANNSSEP